MLLDSLVDDWTGDGFACDRSAEFCFLNEI